MPFAYAQPAHLAALATLHLLSAPPADTARVLELGCAAGGHIIPLAARFPTARFLGIDLSHRHIADGARRIASLGLTNVTLRQGDLTQLDLRGETFDYVVCHGVFSWVPEAAREAILRLCGEALAPEGIAAISYNVLPGWHLRRAIRDLCLRYAGEGAPYQRAQRARAALERMAQSVSDDDPYGLLLRTEAKRLRDVPAAYIVGEFLSPENSAFTFEDFAHRTARHGLAWLCEGDLSASTRRVLAPSGPPAEPTTPAALIAAEQETDFQTGRLFRRSILVRAGRVAHSPAPTAAALPHLHIAAPLQLDAARSNSRVSVFRDGAGRPITAETPGLRRALTRLAVAFPGTVAWQDLAEAELAQPRPHAPEPATAEPAASLPAAAATRTAGSVQTGSPDALETLVLRMLLAGQASALTLPLRVGSPAAEHPTAWWFARREAAARQPWMTTLRHIGIPLPPLLAATVPLLDGTNDRAALRNHLAGLLASGAVRVAELPSAQAPHDPARLQAVAGAYLNRILAHLARHAVLEPSPG
jgi:SAM-dependent methyltransferase